MEAKSINSDVPSYMVKDEVPAIPRYMTIKEYAKKHHSPVNRIDELELMVRKKCSYFGYPIGLPQLGASGEKEYRYPEFLISVCYGEWRGGLYHVYEKMPYCKCRYTNT